MVIFPRAACANTCDTFCAPTLSHGDSRAENQYYTYSELLGWYPEHCHQYTHSPRAQYTSHATNTLHERHTAYDSLHGRPRGRADPALARRAAEPLAEALQPAASAAVAAVAAPKPPPLQNATVGLLTDRKDELPRAGCESAVKQKTLASKHLRRPTGARNALAKALADQVRVGRRSSGTRPCRSHAEELVLLHLH